MGVGKAGLAPAPSWAARLRLASVGCTAATSGQATIAPETALIQWCTSARGVCSRRGNSGAPALTATVSASTSRLHRRHAGAPAPHDAMCGLHCGTRGQGRPKEEPESDCAQMREDGGPCRLDALSATPTSAATAHQCWGMAQQAPAPPHLGCNPCPRPREGLATCSSRHRSWSITS